MCVSPRCTSGASMAGVVLNGLNALGRATLLLAESKESEYAAESSLEDAAEAEK